MGGMGGFLSATAGLVRQQPTVGVDRVGADLDGGGGGELGQQPGGVRGPSRSEFKEVSDFGDASVRP
ncbi:hypothetical protein Slala02_57810 [Streptomyces lavendulae subsp. lavendulae]|nr:hypothetical protein Slala01_61220 [Streptomyces lavendulae subsp. lavendulae]GLX29961.1 hypothetical protein Slala02_57810 [Streptomyces lavendulae subsp. lavendulae]